jgi:hypothetical protein
VNLGLVCLRNLITKIKQSLRIVLILGRVGLVRVGFAVTVVRTIDERTSGSDCHSRRCTLLRSLERVKTSFHVHHPRQSNRKEVDVVFGGQMTADIRHDCSRVQRSGFNFRKSLVKLLGKQARDLPVCFVGSQASHRSSSCLPGRIS